MTATDNMSEKDGLDTNVEEREVGAAAHGNSDEQWKAFDRKLILKLDLLLIPLLTMVYLLAFLDRANVGNARVVSSMVAYKSKVTDIDVVIGWPPKGPGHKRSPIPDW